jgi:hypothetical protein
MFRVRDCEFELQMFMVIAWRLEGWEAGRLQAMKPLSLQASKLSSLPAIFLTPDT